MATGSGIIRKVSGKVGDLVYRVHNGQQVIAAYNPQVKNPQTVRQMQQRAKWLNVLAVYKLMSPYMKGAFENKVGGQSDYNRFMSINLQVEPVYLTRAQFMEGGSIIAPYTIAQGSLPTVGMDGCTTDIAADFGSAATVAEASASILARNPRFKLGDALCFFVLVQGVTAEDTPVVQVYAVKLTLSLTDTTSLSALCTAHAGIEAADGFINVTTDSEVYATATVHTRRSEKLLTSSARLQVVGSVDGLFASASFTTAASSLGYTEDELFLEPDSTASTTTGDAGSGDSDSGSDSGDDDTGTDDGSGDSNPL